MASSNSQHAPILHGPRRDHTPEWVSHSQGSRRRATTLSALPGLPQTIQTIMTWEWRDTLSIEQNECLLSSRSAIDSSGRPTAVVGQGLYLRSAKRKVYAAYLYAWSIHVSVLCNLRIRIGFVRHRYHEVYLDDPRITPGVAEWPIPSAHGRHAICLAGRYRLGDHRKGYPSAGGLVPG